MAEVVAKLPPIAMAGRLGRSDSNRLSIKLEKYCASAAEPALPQTSILLLLKRHCTIRSLALAILATNSALYFWLSAWFSLKLCLMRSNKSMRFVGSLLIICLYRIANPANFFIVYANDIKTTRRIIQ